VHASGVLVAAFCRNEISLAAKLNSFEVKKSKFAMAECHRQHAASVRSQKSLAKQSFSRQRKSHPIYRVTLVTL